MRRMRIIVLLCACILLCACPKQPIQRYITLVNKSGKEIVCQQLWCATITNADTLYECRIPTQGILANSSYLYESKYGWGSDLGFLPYIQYLVLDAEKFHEYRSAPCDTIQKYVPVLYRYQLKLEDLEQMNWTVVYPPEGEN